MHFAYLDHLPVIVSGVGELCPSFMAPFQRQLDLSVVFSDQQQPFCVRLNDEMAAKPVHMSRCMHVNSVNGSQLHLLCCGVLTARFDLLLMQQISAVQLNSQQLLHLSTIYHSGNDRHEAAKPSYLALQISGWVKQVNKQRHAHLEMPFWALRITPGTCSQQNEKQCACVAYVLR